MDKKLPHPSWKGWFINARGELYYQNRPDLVFTADQLTGLHWHLEHLAAERAELRRRLELLQKDCQEKRKTDNLVIFPRYTRQRPG